MPSMTDLIAILQFLHTTTLLRSAAPRRRPTRPGKPRRDRTRQPQQQARNFGTTVAGNVVGRTIYEILSNWLPWI